MRIPTGNFGNQAPSLPQGRQIGNGVDATAQAGQNLAGAMTSVAGALIGVKEEQNRQDQEQQRKIQERQRLQAATVLTDRQLQIQSLHQDLEQRMLSGELPADKAQEAYRSALTLAQTPDLDGMDELTRLHFQQGLKSIDTQGEIKLNDLIAKGQHVQTKAALEGFLDAQGKLAGIPGSDIDAINAKADSLDEQGVAAYGMQWGQVKQNWKDGNWTNQAAQRAMQAADNLGALDQLEQDLTRGFYTDKIDTNKRDAILRTVLSNKNQLLAKAQHEADMREAKAQRALSSIDQQIASGIPATAAMWAQWADTVRGTSAESEFRTRMQDETEVQNVLREPLDKQMAYVQNKQAELMNEGGSVQQGANLNRLANAIKQNLTQLRTEPLLYLQNRTGTPIAPLDMSALTSPAPVPEFADNLRERAASIQAAQKQYGAGLPMKPLLPQEAQMLSQALAGGTPRDQVQIMGNLYRSAGDGAIYQGILQQIAPDMPVKALAGMLMAKQKDLTLQTHWFKPNEVVSSGDVATTLLEGEQLIKQGKAGIPLPADKEFRLAFGDAAGDVFAGRPQAYEIAMQAVRAYYAGDAAKSGDVTGVVDDKRMQHAIRSVLGDVVDFNGNGNVLAPWGMDAASFQDRARAAYLDKAKQLGLPANAIQNFDELGLKNKGDGTYYVVSGRNFLTDRKGNPIVIEVKP